MYFSDKPVQERKDDQLNYTIYADVIAEAIKKEEKGPLTTAIYGPWGAGKSTLLHLIKNRLGEPKAAASYRSIWINAWKYRHENDLRRVILLRVIGFIEEILNEKAKASKEEPTSKDSQQLSMQELDTLRASLYRSVETISKGPVQINWINFLQAISKVILPNLSLVGRSIKGLRHLFSTRPFNDDVEIDGISSLFSILERETFVQYSAQVEAIEQFEDHFHKLLDRLLDEDENLLLIIDDLDRCSPAAIIEVLESTKLFLDSPRVFSFFAIDYEVVIKGLESFYGAGWTLEETKRYLEKMTQLSFHIPPLSFDTAVEYLEKLDTPYGVLSDYYELVLRHCARNPRQIKRFYNAYLLFIPLAEQQLGKKSKDWDSSLRHRLIFFHILSFLYPEFYKSALRDTSVSRQFASYLVNMSRTSFKFVEEAISRFVSDICTPEFEQDSRENLVKLLASAPEFQNIDEILSIMKLFQTQAPLPVKGQGIIEPNEYWRNVKQGNELFHQGEYREAIRYYQKALAYSEIDGKGEIYNNIGLCYRYLEDFAQAKQYFRRALEEKNYTVQGDAYYNLGYVLSLDGDFTEAINQYLEATKLPHSDGPGWTYNNLGYCYMKIGKPDEARVYFNRALNVPHFSGCRRTYFNLGLLDKQDKQFDQALENFGKALKEKDKEGLDSARIYDEMADCCEKLGNPEKAQEYREKAQEYRDKKAKA